MPALSPNTQAMMGPPPTGENAKAAFEEGFSNMAHSILSSKFPELVEQVVTFQTLSSDIDTGSAVGAFILSRNGTSVHIPVILANNQIKPIEIMYVKDQDVFLPLQPGWLEEIDRSNLDSLGEGMKPPEGMATDVDIRNLVVPPSSGRYSYASAEPGTQLAQFLSDAPNVVKMAFQQILETRPRVLKYVAENLNKEAVFSALKHHVVKTAGPRVHLLTPESTPKKFRSVFGKKAGAAFQKAAQQGYVMKDEREFFKVAVETEEPLWLHEGKENGFYRIQLSAGGTIDAIVIANPRHLTSSDRHGKGTGATPLHDHYADRVQMIPEQFQVFSKGEDPDRKIGHENYLVITEKREIVICEHAPMGEWLPVTEISDKLQKILEGADQPTKGFGAFIRYEGGTCSGTVPFSVDSTTTDSKGVRRTKVDSLYGPKVVVTDPKSAIRQIVAPKGDDITYVPPAFKFVKGTYTDAKMFATPQDQNYEYRALLGKAGAAPMVIKNAHNGMFSLGGHPAQTKIATLWNLVVKHGLRESEAGLMLKRAAAKPSHSFYLVSPIQMIKFAMLCKEAQPPPMGAPQGAPPQGMPPEEAPPEGAPPGAEMQGAMTPPEGMPMEGGMMPPEMMAPPMPPPPDPVQVAVTEIGSQLAQQAAEVAQQLAEQERDLSNQLNVLDAVQQRSMQLAAEMSGMSPEELGEPVGAPMDAAGPPVGSEEMMGPEGAPPGMDPGMAPPGMGPEGAPGMAPGMDPGMAPPGMGPEGAPPGMPQEGPMATQMANEGGPPMEEAAALEDPAAFEATAIGSMASNPDLRGIVAMYVPVLEQALDHLSKILLTLWIQEEQYRTELGEKDFAELEERMRTVLSNLGSLVLRINQTAMAAKPQDEMGAGA